MSEFNIDTKKKIQSDSINNIPQRKLDSKENGKLKKDVNFKENIKFTYSSFKRRNVDKALVRALSSIRKEVKTEILEEYKINHIDKMLYNEIAITLDKINDGVRRSSGKKDYSYIINWMMSDTAHRIMLKICLQKKKQMIEESVSKRVKGKNQNLYKTTLDDYLNYIDSI